MYKKATLQNTKTLYYNTVYDDTYKFLFNMATKGSRSVFV